jgi:hypothetical protein
MAKLVGVRKQLFWTWWDTALHAVGPCEVPPGVALFGNANVGNFTKTNMRAPSQFPADDDFLILSAPMLVGFENEKLYGVLGRCARVRIQIGSKTLEEHPLPTAAVRSDRPPSQVVSDEDFVTQCGQIVRRLEEQRAYEEAKVDERTRALKVEWRHAMLAAQALAPGGLAVPIPVAPRQWFEVVLTLGGQPENAPAVIGESPGAKSIVQCLRGILTRDAS